MMPRIALRTILLVAALAAVAPAGTGDAREAGKAAGKWYYWGSCEPVEHYGYGARSLWFGVSRGMLWRYDVTSRKVRGFTLLDGLPLDGGSLRRLAVAPDETCVIQINLGGTRRMYLWRPKVGWRPLPGPDEGRDSGLVAFSPDSRLYCVRRLGKQAGLFRRDKGAWVKLRDVPACQRLVALKKGFFLGSLGVGGSEGPVYVDAKAGEPVAYDKQWRRIRGHWHVGDETFGLFPGGGRASICRITPGKIAAAYPSEGSRPIGPDLTGKGYLNRIGPVQRGREMIYGIGSTTDSKVTKGFGNRQLGGRLVRDANGHIWSGPARWDGGTWQTMLPPGHLTGDAADLVDRRWFTLDAKTMTWRRINKHVPPAMRKTFDPATQTAWWFHSVGGKHVWQFLKFTGAKRRVLRTIAHVAGGPNCKDSAGNWWGPARRANEFFAVRFDPRGKVHLYPAQRGGGGAHRPQMQCSPAGNAWLWDNSGPSRYDPKQDKFVHAEPWEEFAFRFGPWRLSMAGKITHVGQEIRRWEQGRWKPLANPFAPGTAVGNRNMIWRDRMLIVAQDVGVLEYDATADRWAVLHGSPAFQPSFDAEGRRILVDVGGALLFDGDPFAPGAADKDSAVFNELLKLMDDDSWRVRDAATKKLKKLYPTMRGRLKAALGRPGLSPEVEARIKLLLQGAEGTGRIRLRGLFRRTHPLIE